MSYYTNVALLGDSILYRGIENGERVIRREKYSPNLFVPTRKSSKYHLLDGTSVDKIQFQTISEAKEFLEQYKDSSNFRVNGFTDFKYCHISDHFSNTISFNIHDLVVANIDIETGTINEFPNPETALEPIYSIAMRVSYAGKDVVYILAYPPRPDAEFKPGEKCVIKNGVRIAQVDSAVHIYHKCADEQELLETFLTIWQKTEYPDIVTSWNGDTFDIPYLVNRITRVLGPEAPKRLSPWKRILAKKKRIRDRETLVFDLVGISQLDYMALYKKFGTMNAQESYALNYIAYVELGEKKVNYDEYGDLETLRQKNYQKFLDYNVNDTALVANLDHKKKLIELALNLAYNAKVNYEDVFSQVRMWEVICYNELKSRNLVVPLKTYDR